jgi:hypothetical protein
VEGSGGAGALGTATGVGFTPDVAGIIAGVLLLLGLMVTGCVDGKVAGCTADDGSV